MGAKEAAEFKTWVEANINERRGRENAAFRQVLHQLASWGEGEVVMGSFDEPHAAKAAREVLAAGWIGPCLHGRDPFDRCDDCGDAGEVVAMARVIRAQQKMGCKHEGPQKDDQYRVGRGITCEACGYYRYEPSSGEVVP